MSLKGVSVCQDWKKKPVENSRVCGNEACLKSYIQVLSAEQLLYLTYSGG